MNQQRSKKMTVGLLLTLFGLGAFASNAQAAAWEDVKLKGDLRYRHEMKETEGVDNDRHRQRIRGRVGLWGPVNDKVKFGLRLATGSISNNTSTNQTLDDAANKKQFNLDMYYATWTIMEETSLTLGKMENPLYRAAANPMLWDSDVTPEGLAFAYNRNLGAVSTFFNLGGFWHNEISGNSDVGVIAAQLGFVVPVGEHKFTVGASHNSFANIQGTAPINGSLGNTTDSSGNYANEFVVTEFFAEFQAELAGLPLTVGGSFFSNSEASAEDKGHWAAIILGDVKKTNWAVKYANFKVEADSTLGDYTDSDALGGGTNGKGNLVAGSYGLGENTQVDLTYWISETGISGTSTTDVKTAQLDFLFKF